MAPNKTPGRKKRDGDYSAIGRYGRKTGIAIPDLGPRDEYGLEPIDELFSSPRRGLSPPLSPSGEKMDVEYSVQPEIASVINSNRRRTQLFPKSRSPIKTSLGSSPHHPLGTLSSSPRSNLHVRDLSTAPPPSAQISLSLAKNDRIKRGYRHSPNELASTRNHLPFTTAPRTRPMRSTLDLMDENATSEDYSTVALDKSSWQDPLDMYSSDGEGDDLGIGPIKTMDLSHAEEDSERSFDTEPISTSDAVLYGTNRENARSTRQPRLPAPYQAKRKFAQVDDEKLEAVNSAVSAAKVDSPPKEIRPRHSTRTWRSDNQNIRNNKSQQGTLKVSMRQSRGRAPGQRKLTARISSSKGKAIAGENNSVSINRGARTEEKSNYVEDASQHPTRRQASNQAAAGISPTILRSGRTSVKPLAFWRGQQILYDPPKRIGKGILPGGYKGIDPGRQVTETTSRAIHRRPRRQQATAQRLPLSEDSDSYRESWEQGGDVPGVLTATIMAWDVHDQKGVEEAHDFELALAPTAINERIQWDKAKTFKFGKTLTLPFFHSGVVDLPPGGEKRPKNSRKNHMIFWVFSGRVRVDVSGNVFSIGRGGMWQVPRGNVYGLSNPFDRDTRIFFAQGSYMEQPEEETALTATMMA